jgi:hypothetical protein
MALLVKGCDETFGFTVELAVAGQPVGATVTAPAPLRALGRRGVAGDVADAHGVVGMRRFRRSGGIWHN